MPKFLEPPENLLANIFCGRHHVLEFRNLFGGALVTETVFSWPGVGRLYLDSLNYQDYSVILGLLLITSVMVLAGSLLADILYAVVDPRVRLR